MRRLSRLLTVVLTLCLIVPSSSDALATALFQSQHIEPQAVALRPADLPPGFTVTKEDSQPMDPGPGALYSVVLDRPITPDNVANGPIGVIQIIGRFDQAISYAGFLDELRRKAVDEDGFELVPGAPNDGGTASLQKLDGDVASFRVGFIKRDMVIFTGWVGKKGVVSLQGLLTLAGVSSQRYDDALLAQTGVPAVTGGAPAPAADGPQASAPASTTTQHGRVANTGGTGANLRALPQVNSDLLQVVQDGEVVDLIGVEEKGADGRAWRNVKTSTGVTGWLVGEYVTTDAQPVAAAPASAPSPPPPPPPPPTPTATPMPALPTPPAARIPPTPVPQPSGTYDSRLSPALKMLLGIRRGPTGKKPWGDWYAGIIDGSGVNIVVEALPLGVGGAYRARTNTVSVGQSLLLSEDTRTVATILAHELTHVAQAFRGGDPASACVESEVEAVQNEIVISIILYQGPTPGRTIWEREENARTIIWGQQGDPGLYKMVVDSPSYQDECGLWVP